MESKRPGGPAGTVDNYQPGKTPGSVNPENGGDESIDSVPLFRKKRVVIPLLIFAVLATVAVAYWYVKLRRFVSTDNAYLDGNRVSISSKLLGRVTQLTVEEGDGVKPGQALAYLDNSDLKAQEAQSQAELEQAEKNVALAKINLERAQEDFERAKTLLKGGSATREQFDHAQKGLEISQAQYHITQAQVGVSRARLEVVRTQLQNTVISSPLEGVVAKKWVMPGDVVQPAQPIFSINDSEHVWITANFEETKLGAIRIGDPVEISVDTYSGRAFSGKVIQIGSNTASKFSLIPPDNASGNFTKVTQRVPVKISVEMPASPGDADPPRLLPGMSVEVKIKVK
ncbi:MAG: HlyD family secretion protein [bacterium]|nr:HlyD family secretion protein [bacterium]